MVFHPKSKKHTTGALTHTHTRPATTTNKKQLGTSHRVLMVISLAQSNKERYNFADIGFNDKERNVSSVRDGLANGTKRTPSQNWGDLLPVPHKQCLTGVSNAFSASFTSIWPSFPWFYCTPNKAYLLCATPAGAY